MPRVCAAGRWLPIAALLFVLPLLFDRGFAEQFSYPKLAFTEIVLLAALAPAVAALTGASRRRPALFPQLAPALFFCGAVLLAAADSAAPVFSLRQAVYLLCGPAWLMMLSALGISGADAVRTMARCAALSGAVVAAAALLQWVGYDPMVAGGAHVDFGNMVPRMRLYATLGNPNFVAGFLIAVVFLTLALAVAATARGTRIAWSVAGLLVLLAIAGAGSFGAWAGLAAGSLAAGAVWNASASGVRTRGGFSRALRRSAAIVLAAVLLGGGLLFVAARRSLRTEAIASTPERRLAGRVYLARVAWPLFARHPWVGSGPGAVELQFLDLQGQFLATHPESARLWSNVVELHNDPLQLLLETGLLGCAGFAWMLLAWGAGLRRALASSPSLAVRAWLTAGAGGVAAILVDSLFDFQFAIAPTWILLFTLLAFPSLLAARESAPRVAARLTARRRFLQVFATALALGFAAAGIAFVARLARAERRYAAGLRQEESEAYAAAERSYRDGVRLDARNGRLHFGLARVLYLESRFPEALSEAAFAGETFSDAHLAVLKARIEDEMGAAGPALADYRRALWLDPTLQSVQADIARLEK